MEQQTSRELILNRIRRIAERRGDESAANVTYQQEEVYKTVGPDLLACFKQELEAVSGKCVVCSNEEDMYKQLAALVEKKELPSLFSRDAGIIEKLCKAGIIVEERENNFIHQSAGITSCELLVARTGSVLVNTAGNSGRQMHVFPPIHIVLAKASQLVAYVGDALEAMQQKYNEKLPSAITIITGPSRTADIEKTLVLGAHGPKELIIFVDQSQ
ncbi:MAG: lactate utilization protein [Paludibacter sp.]|nr:lactate utilization protein [Paludibacter sp.]